MSKLKKQYFRNKCNNLGTYPYCLIIDISNSTSTEINQLIAQVNSTNCYTSLTYTKPPKITGGGLLIRLFPKTLEDIESNIDKVLTKNMFLGLYIKKYWYNVQLTQDSKNKNKNKNKILSLLIKKSYNTWLNDI